MAAGVAYAKRYGAGFTDGDAAKPADSAFLNAVEAALLQILGSAPTADGQVAQWDFANTRFGPALLLNKNIDPAAGIVKSKLDFTGANGIVNADIAGAAAIATSKLANPADVTKVLRGDGTYGYASTVTYRKNTAKAVVNTVAETDLLNGEITVAANAMGANGALRLTAMGDLFNNAGGAFAPPRFKLKLGATTLIDTNVLGAVFSAGVNRLGWRLDAVIQNLGATNSQQVNFVFNSTLGNGVSAALVGFVSGNGLFFATLVSGGFGTLSAIGDNTTAVDTTSAQALAFTVVNGAANANYDTTLRGALVEIL